MSFVKLVAFLMVSAVVVTGMPTYVAIPISDLEALSFVAEPVYEESIAQEPLELEPETSESNVAEEYVEAPSNLVPAEDRSKRQSGHHGDHVDYGAYTGSHGSFGWYTDHPVGRN